MVEKKESKNSEAYGIIGLTLGILSIVYLASNGIILSIIGFVFSVVQQKRNPTKFGKTGMILNVIGFVLGIVFIIVALVYLKPLFENQFPNFPIQ